MPNIPAAKIVIPEADRREILALIDESLRTGALTLGPLTKQFEAGFAALTGSKYAIAVNSGTSALEIPLRVLGVEGKEVVVPSNTFFATPAAVLHAGGKVRFADVDPSTFALSLETVRAALTPKTVGVIIVHIGGIVSPETPAIAAFCKEKGLFFLEDAAHAHGSTLGGKAAGTFGVAASFSFYPTKVMTSGEGGMIVTDDERIYREALQYRDQGKEGFTTNFHVRLGYNWRLSELHTAVGISQLKRLPEFLESRRRAADQYTKALAGLKGLTPVLPAAGSLSNFYKYIVRLEPGIDRARFKKTMKEKHSVSLSGEVYEVACHRQPVFAPYATEALPGADEACGRHVCLPVYAGMTTAEVDQVVGALSSALEVERTAACA
jgi:dTDP-4-amino-4,6-dideoxygalactose transaminase